MTTNANDLRVLDYYRRAAEGHVFIQETLDAFITIAGSRMDRIGPRPRVLELGCHAGFVTRMLICRRSEARIVAVDDDAELVGVARRQLADAPHVTFHPTLEELPPQSIDLVVSVARHHHLAHDYLAGVRRAMRADAVYVLADEFCPEYCAGEHAARVAGAEVLHVAAGHILTSKHDVEAYERTGAVPAYAVEVEQLRRRALWRWYRFVVDRAVDRGFFDIAISEIKSTHDDLITGSAAEHKFSPSIVERQLTLAGFRQLSKRLIGPPDEPERQSMFIYEFGLA